MVSCGKTQGGRKRRGNRAGNHRSFCTHQVLAQSDYLNDVQSRGELRMKTLISFLTLCAVLGSQAWAQSSQDLQKYVPVLPSVKASFWEIDPKLGYAAKSVGGGVYVMSDNGWQSAFLVTEEGVIVFDAPASFGKSI